MPVDDEPEQPQSIASLRSKFENLAADQKGLREKERSRPASPTPAKVPAAGSWARNGQGVLNRPATGRGEESGEVEGVDAARRAGIALPLESGGQRGPAVDGLLFDGGVSGVGHNQAPRSRSPLPIPIRNPVGDVKITSASPVPPIDIAHQRKMSPPVGISADSEPDGETGLSVRALQDRFGGGSRTQSPMSSRAPSPTPSFGRTGGTSHTGNTALIRPQNASTSTLAHMTERERLPVPIQTSQASGERTVQVSSGDDARGASLEVQRSRGGGRVDMNLSASPQPMSALVAEPANDAGLSESLDGVDEAEKESQLSATPHAPPPVAARPSKAPPPPPVSRHSAIPSSSSSTSTGKPINTSTGEIRRAPPPAPASRLNGSHGMIGGSTDAGSSSANASSNLSRASTVRAPPTAPPPALPARKLSLPQDVQLPPPIPGNRPTPSGPQASAASPSTLEGSRPVLPARPRGDTVVAPPITPVPQLPIRSETAPADLPPPPARTAEAAGAGLTRRITRKAVPSDGASGIGRQNSVRQPIRRGSVQVPPPDDEYVPPPPPARTGGAVVPIPPRQNSREGGKEADSDEDDPDEHVAGLTSNAKRLLDDYPDSTHANRRPPSFVPDIKISGTSHTTAFAAHGRHVCTGTHCVKVYDTLMSDQPLFVVDLKETGLDFRVKENRVTAMCFRPANNTADEGRYLWCGTKDGHLWELDIKTGDITDTRAFVHSSAVSHIFRYKSWIMSLEEGGKLHVFQVQDNRRIPQCRTIRVQERFNFAKLIGGRLWTSTGPANRSTTNAAASRGPTIRVYDPCAPGTTLSSGTTVWPSEWTGAVTSATCMPMHPGTVYVGHEGGFVSVWDAKQLTCLQVLKISANDILALEGVGERLWAAGRKGMISVYDVSNRPWRTTNVWTAHIEFAIHELVVDPYSVQDTGRFILWSLAKDGLRAWDGLLSVDWVDQQMTARQVDYCSFREVRALICSWNIDSARPHDLNGTEADQRFFPQLFASVDAPPEILVFGFQEVIPLTDKKLTAKTLIFGGKDKDSDKISGAYRQWLDKLTAVVYHAYPDTPYVRVHSENMVGLLTCVFVKADERDILRDVDVCTVKRGIGGIYGNKGAIVARLVIDDTSICFINVHLAAGQSAKAARTADLAAIMEDKAVFPPSDALPYIRGGDGTAISDHELVILNGDLNYRIDQRRENVVASISAGDLYYLLEHDQLRKEMRNNHAFRLRSFDEAPIRFEPTYKYNPGTQDYDTSEKNRIPAWILYSKSDRIHPLHYKRYEPTVSDHRPISAAYALKVKAVNWERMKAVREEVRGEWAKREADVLERIERAYLDLL